MSSTDEEIMPMVKRQDTFLERADRIPGMLEDWEGSVMNRLDQVEGIEPMDRTFAVMNFHRNELAVLGSYQMKASIRTLGIVGATQSFQVGGDTGMDVSFKPEAEFIPEKIASDKLTKLAKGKSEKLNDEFDEFVVMYLDQEGKKLDPPVNLAEMVIKQVLSRIDGRVDAKDLVDIRSVVANLELLEGQQNKGYKLNDNEKEVYDLLLPLTSSEPQTQDEGLRPTRLPYSVGSALKYVFNKSAHYFLSDVKPSDEYVEPERPVKVPNALEASILNLYQESGLTAGSVNRRNYGREELQWYLNSLGGELSFAQGNITMFYSQERFKKGELVKLYDYPDLDKFL